jgi:hypothetical protein
VGENRRAARAPPSGVFEKQDAPLEEGWKGSILADSQSVGFLPSSVERFFNAKALQIKNQKSSFVIRHSSLT